MSSSRLYYAKKECPFCGEVGSLEVDTVEAEVFCTECAMVVARGLEEDEATRYLGDEGLSAVTRTEGAAADEGGDEGGRGGMMSMSENAKYTLVPASAQQYLAELDDKAKLGTRFAPAALTLFEEFMRSFKLRTGRASTAGDGGELALATACYMLASARRFTPCPVHELYTHAALCSEVYKKVAMTDKTVVCGNPVTPPFTELNILTKRSEVTNELGLGQEIGELGRREHGDLANMYLQRLKWSLATFSPIVTAVSKALGSALEGTAESRAGVAIGTAEAVCVGLFLCKTSKAVVRAMGVDAVPQTELKKLLEVISWASFLSTDKVMRSLKRLNANPEAQTKIAAVAVQAHMDNVAAIERSALKARTPSSTTATYAVGKKRERN